MRTSTFEIWKPYSGLRGDMAVKNAGCKSLKPSFGSPLNFTVRNSIYMRRCSFRSNPRNSKNKEREISLWLSCSSSEENCVNSGCGLRRSYEVVRLGPARGIKISRESTLDKAEGNEYDDDDDTDLCPVECVREFQSRSEFDEILQHAKEQNSLVVVDFFKTACGSCRYIEKGFVKLCKGAGNSDVSVIFLKHNVMDEYEEQSEVAEALKIRVVPLFHFYKNGNLVDYFSTREKKKILETICKHTGIKVEDMPNLPKS